MGKEAGMRIGAILSADSESKTLDFLGYGTYAGEEVPPEEVGGLLSQLGFPNPKMTLDNGEVVWGCQCWWGPEDKIKNQIQAYVDNGYTINEVKLSEILATSAE